MSADEIEHPDLFAESDLPLLDETEEIDITESKPAQEEVIKDETPVVEKKKWRRQVFDKILKSYNLLLQLSKRLLLKKKLSCRLLRTNS